MNLRYLAAVFWARRIIVILAFVSTLLGGVAMILTTAPRYEATSRVELDIVKPDPITGIQVTAKNATAYMNSQMQEIRDFQVAGRAAEDLGWTDNADLQQQYASLPPGTSQDFAHWVAQRIIDQTYVVPVQESNILEIRVRSVSPEIARLLSATVRNAYINATAEARQQAAAAGLPTLKAKLEVSRAKLVVLEDRKSAMERETGLILQDNGRDLDSQRLSEMARTVPRTILPGKPERQSTASYQLQEVDAAIARQTAALGPKNPVLIELQRRRQALGAVVQSQSSAKDEAGRAVLSHQQSIGAQLAQQTSKVIGQSAKLTQLRLLQDEINAESGRYAMLSLRIVANQRMAGGGGGTVVPVGPTDGPDKPVSPNPPLVLGGSAALGLMTGLLLAFMTEMSARRVRTEREVLAACGATVVVLPPARRSRLSWWRLPFRRAAAA